MKKNHLKTLLSNKIEDYKVFLKSVKITYSLDKKFFWMQIINVISDRLRPFLNTYISSLVINGIYQELPSSTLIIYAFIAVLSNFILNILVLFTANRRYIRKSMWGKVILLFFNKSALNMDYSNFEDIDVRDNRKRIERNIKQGKGISNYGTWQNLIGALISIFTSSTIISTLIFTKNTTDVKNTFINSPVVSIIFICFLFSSFIFSNWYEKTSNDIYREGNDFLTKNWRLANRLEKYPIDNKLSMEYNIFGLHETIYKCVEKATKNSIKFEKNFDIRMAKREILSLLVKIITRFIAISFVALKAVSGAFGPGSIVLYIGTIIQLSNAVSSIGWALGNIHGSRKILDDEFKYLEIKNMMSNEGLKSISVHVDHTIEFKNVSFKYPKAKNYSLKNINIKICNKDHIAIVGKNGSGKSTFVKLLCRLYDPQEGQILLDGIDIKQYDYKEYLKLFSVVFQDYKLFAYTLGENIAVNKEFDSGRINQCLESVGLLDRVSQMPKGIYTCLYKRFDSEGVEISGGEAQKIAIARALYKDGPYVVLDEPTAALDPLSEFEIFSDLNKLIEKKTAIYISHRLSSCKFCDKILVFDEGELIQTGSHEQLISQNGKYAELWSAQAFSYNNDINF